MSALVFLGGALGVFMLLSLVAWFAQRPRRRRFGSSIDQFRDEMDALAPDWLRDERDSKRR